MIGHAFSIHKVAQHVSGLKVVVLSHADEDTFALSDEQRGRRLTGAFHLLFIDSDTHPDLITHWMNLTRIHAENRIHVVRGR